MSSPFLTCNLTPNNPKPALPVSKLRFTQYPPRLWRKQIRYKPKSSEHENTDTNDVTQRISRANVTVSGDNGNATNSFLSVLCPLLKLFSAADPSQERNYSLEVATSSLSTLARLPWGSRTVSGSLNSQEISSGPPLRLQLYEFEACPFCRRVREAITELDLSVEVYPCPKGSLRHRDIVRRLGGKEQFPFFVDPNTGISLYESGEIVKYLFQQYGDGKSPTPGLLESTLLTGWMPTLLRAGRGMTLWEKATLDPPPEKLELFSYENNSVPFIIDHNSGTQIGDYKKILSYLFETYSVAIE